MKSYTCSRKLRNLLYAINFNWNCCSLCIIIVLESVTYLVVSDMRPDYLGRLGKHVQFQGGIVLKSTNSYLHTYISKITPRLQEIDLFIKSSGDVLNPVRVAHILELSENEVAEIARKKNILRISRQNFFEIMAMGSSFICGLYRREIECGSPYIYTRADIAYIYQIDIDQINSTCDALGIHEVTAYTLPDLLAQIAV